MKECFGLKKKKILIVTRHIINETSEARQCKIDVLFFVVVVLKRGDLPAAILQHLEQSLEEKQILRD